MRWFLIFISTLFAFTETTWCFSQELPIKPSRIISFKTDEGTGMNVDVSPDGKTLVFDLLGDLYTIPVAGGKATQLTKGIALNVNPALSHDGRQIAYISDGSGVPQLNIEDVSGASHKVLGGRDERLDITVTCPIWSPDGNSIELNHSIYNVADGSKLSLPDSIGWIAGSSADGECWYYVRAGKLYRYDLENRTDIIMPVLKGLQTCISSPDGRWLVYIASVNMVTSLIVRNLLNGTERVLVVFTAHSRIPTHFSFSPDSKNIYISYTGKIHKIDVENGTDNIIPFTCDVQAGLGPLDYNTFRVGHDPVKVKYIRSASESPDGKRLVFSALNRVYIKDLPDGKPRILALQPLNQYQPSWSPDGKWITYVTWCDTSGGELWKVRVPGGKPIQVTKVPGEYQRPVWSPDGKTIAVVKGGPSFGIDTNQRKLNAIGRGVPALGDRDDPGIGQLQLVSVDNHHVRAIADSIPLWNQLAFSPDGSRIIYEPKMIIYDRNKAAPQLISKELNGNSINILAVRSGGYGEVGQSWLLQRSLSPDGRYIVYSRGEDLYMLPMAKVTMPVFIYDDDQNVPVIRFAKGVDPNWEHGGKALCWTYANQFYKIDPDKVIAAAAKAPRQKKVFGFKNDGCTTTTVSPDESILVTITEPGYYAHGTIALKNARIITMQGDQVIEKGIVLIKDGRFTAIGAANNVRIPKGVKIIDLSGKTIMPGFVDLHLHMRVPSNVFPQQSWMYLINLAYGVTTARDPSSSYDSFGYSELLQSGQMIGPRLFSSGMAVRTGEGIRFDNPADALGTVQKRKLLGGTFMKQYILPTRVQREWLLMAASEEGLNMTNEGGTQGWLTVLGMLKDGSSGVEHNFDGDAYNDVITFIAKCGTYFTPTLQVTPEPGAKAYFNYKYWHGHQEKLARFNHVHTDYATGNGAEGYDWITGKYPKIPPMQVSFMRIV